MDEDDRRLQREDPDKWLERALRHGLVLSPGRTIVLGLVKCGGVDVEQPKRLHLCGECIFIAAYKLSLIRRANNMTFLLDALLG